MKKSVLAGAAAAGVTLAAVVLPGTASAAETTVTFTIAAGNISITAPGAASLTENPLLDTATGSITGVKVTDDRRGFSGWTATASSTAFTNGTGEGTTSIGADKVTYTAPLAIPTGVAVVTPGLPGTLAAARNAQVATAVLGSNSVTWSPTLSVALPPDRTSGTYSGKITHSLA
ncbi:hypothetical protein HQ325_06405 [Rhodococcus sp. BP-349]|uniref:hypothetical protein n=1 Tax=unclassified Rhodococcus (in: high G+C Gram-positive bacteria) TaxID=192944 RepID=UPI001C9B2E21|nr:MULTISPECIES: hypothetical protein [unclassified Rhodococcus (in: high G+C Gram-positive bacteria)]MBY6538297.1 hypothetical protein [Rhodococcus sp. BP-363]MBY6542634.1 hypothetical protein [Rhodococcus sp. BP-369]MBY6561864.1 hypothetical protein [Rhodococcus sp. BP-370]MBY6576156.1 hypothetical protein [Rhodococcus sp. BP-364]MBY6585457.1 hypothetical protein [Rhodococcus sp. BP-358]